MFNSFTQAVIAASSEVTCDITGGIGSCKTHLDCASLETQMLNLTIQIDKVYYILPPVSLTETDFNCRILVEYDQSIGELTMIGLPFFENFVTVYEYENGRV